MRTFDCKATFLILCNENLYGEAIKKERFSTETVVRAPLVCSQTSLNYLLRVVVLRAFENFSTSLRRVRAARVTDRSTKKQMAWKRLSKRL